MLSVVQQLSSSHDFHGRRCPTLNFDPWPWKPFSNAQSSAEYVCLAESHRNHSTKHRDIAPREQFFWPFYDLDLWPLTLKIFLSDATHVMIICARFYWNPFSKYRNIAGRGMCVNGQWTDRWTDGPTDNPKIWCARIIREIHMLKLLY